MKSASASTTPRESWPHAVADAARPSARAIFVGCAVGAVLSISNLSLGLKTGWWESGAVLAAAAGVVGARGRPRTADILATQSIAMAAGAAPAAAGLLGLIPAIVQSGVSPAPATLLLYGFATAVFGIVLAFALAPALLDDERLPFPTGEAAARAVESLTGRSGEEERRALVRGGAASAAVVALRDGLGWLPPASISGFLGIGVAWSPMVWAIGSLVGMRAAISVAAGSTLGTGWASAGEGSPEWGMWPGASLLAGAATVACARLARSSELFAGFRASRVPLAIGAFAGVIAGVSLGLPWSGAILAAAIAVVLGSACAHAAGLTDVAPAGAVGQLAQAGLGTASASASAGGALASGAAGQASVSLWACRTAQVLSQPRRGLLRLQIAGAAVGCLAAVPSFAILSRGAVAPGAAQWLLVERVLQDGVPSSVLPVSLAALFAGIALSLAAARPRHAWLPSPVALGTGMLLPLPLAVTMLIGAVWTAYRRSPARAFAASGAIAGEAITALVVAIFVTVAA